MRHILFAVTLLLPVSAAAGPDETALTRAKPAGTRIDCLSTQIRHADLSRKGQFNRLGDLPPGDLHLAVVREVDGCQQPVIVRQGYGSLARPESPGR